MNWYLAVLKNYAQFNGRARRKEYWMFVLFSCLISIVLGAVEWLLGLPAALSGLYSLAVLVPSIAVLFRRLHDTGRSGWWVLLLFVPLLGALAILFFTAQEGESGENAYGPNPKA
jgi:uncharacterized membrane protein YhaH (DUF805 family)